MRVAVFRRRLRKRCESWRTPEFLEVACLWEVSGPFFLTIFASRRQFSSSPWVALVLSRIATTCLLWSFFTNTRWNPRSWWSVHYPGLSLVIYMSQTRRPRLPRTPNPPIKCRWFVHKNSYCCEARSITALDGFFFWRSVGAKNLSSRETYAMPLVPR